MSEENKPMEVGHAMTDLLLIWKNDTGNLSNEDVASAIMLALERYSIERKGSGEAILRGCLLRLREKIDHRIMAI